MLDQEVSSYGVVEADDAADDIAVAAEEFLRLGCTTLPSGIEEPQLSQLRDALDAAYERQAAELGEGQLASSDDADIARCLLAYDDTFLGLARNGPLIELCTRLLGANVMLLQQNGIINRPDREQYQLRWHRDLPFQHWVATKPIALGALFCLDEFSAATGGTYVLPGSHSHESFPSDTFVRRHQSVVSAPAGTFLVMDAMVYHRAGLNTSGRPRRAVNHLIGLPFLAQQIDLPRALNGKYADDPELAAYLGYRWAPAADVPTWRAGRMAPPAGSGEGA